MHVNLPFTRLQTFCPRSLLVATCLAVWIVTTARAQTVQDSTASVTATAPTPVATDVPVADPAPVVVATPSPAGGNTGTLGVTDLSGYVQARRPSISVVIAVPGSTSAQNGASTGTPALQAAGTTVAGPSTTMQPQILGGVVGDINLGVLNGGNPPPLATVTLQFASTRAGALVWVQTLDGGTLQAQDAGAGMVTAQNGFWMELNTLGQVTFTFQAPASPMRYQVLLRLDNIPTVLPFVVPDPDAYH